MFWLRPGRLKVLRCPLVDVVFRGTVTAIVLLTPTGARAQVETSSQSAAIEEVRQSPLWTAKSAVPLGIDVPKALWLPMAFQAPAPSIQTPANDSTFPHGRVFFTALGADGLVLLPTLFFGYSAAFGSNHGDAYALAAIALPVLGAATGAKLAGARFLPALAGSTLGFAAAVTTLFAAGDAPGAGALWIVLPVMHAGVTTFVASHFN